ncbi:tetratricopeptide repeat protein [Flavobacterium azooxidireducens]|uniref:Tetratricopeptide repeat protein n=1 Tax=Flavobacterium azooxidireducens TaxID=1871076 RepID=A0ABY4KI16_9FLAO|nr:tetratricopeptide repeat protein [Flavobacterium azooxidireducens]UPQ80189.1 tetratricopeptide repeat protein [Flavobacterium azooxidireducens]
MQEEIYILFENYLSNEMNEKDRLSFENQLLADSQLKEKFELYQQNNQFLATKFSTKKADFESNLKTISKNYFEQEIKEDTKVFKLKRYYFAIAASVVFFLGLLVFLQNSNPEYNDFNQHEIASFTVRNDSDESSFFLKEAQDFFNQKKYDLALQAFQKMSPMNNTEEKLFYGITLLETDNLVEAKAVFVEIENGTSIYQNKATWYLALLALKENDLETCKLYLKKLPKNADDFQQAQKLLNKIE